VIVGANNAGKSTIVEALRLVALVTERLRSPAARFVEPPEWLTGSRALIGVAPPVRGLPTDAFAATLFHRYGPPPATVTATFLDGAAAAVFVGPDSQVHGAAWDAFGNEVTGRRQAAHLRLDPIAVQPQVAPLLRNEIVRKRETIHRGDGTYLAPQHFRNQLRLFSEHAATFASIAEETWPGLQIRELPNEDAPLGARLELHVRDEDFVGEVSLMGHGLQMWLQIVWFLARTPPDAVVVLDEPDVYMHPDLQRRLLSLVRTRFRQLLIATHSIEIIADVDPQTILSVDRRQAESTFVASLPGLQDVVTGLGAPQNIDLARLMRSRSFCLVEGDDVGLLRILQATASPSAHPIDLVPGGRLGGRGGWGAGIPQRLPTTNAEGQRIRSYALLDRDYFPEDEVAERYAEGRQWGVDLHIWSRKELENFLLVPAAISRYVANQVAERSEGPDGDEVAAEMDRIIATLKEDVILDGIVEALHPREKRKGPSGANKVARTRVREAWKTAEGRRAIAPGKHVLGQLSSWSKSNFGVQFNPEQLARTLRADEIDTEVVTVIDAIVRGHPLKS
jgi:hypothetical protein